MRLRLRRLRLPVCSLTLSWQAGYAVLDRHRFSMPFAIVLHYRTSAIIMDGEFITCKTNKVPLIYLGQLIGVNEREQFA